MSSQLLPSTVVVPRVLVEVESMLKLEYPSLANSLEPLAEREDAPEADIEGRDVGGERLGAFGILEVAEVVVSTLQSEELFEVVSSEELPAARVGVERFERRVELSAGVQVARARVPLLGLRRQTDSPREDRRDRHQHSEPNRTSLSHRTPPGAGLVGPPSHCRNRTRGTARHRSGNTRRAGSARRVSTGIA